MDREMFDRIRSNHGDHASWAVWAKAGETPKSNVSDLSVLDPERNPVLLDTLRPDVVMLGLNISRPFFEPFRNFHDSNPSAQDFKIRHAFAGTPFYGAYMTDIIKDVVMVNSGDLMSYLRLNPALVAENVERMISELDDLKTDSPTVIAFGAHAHRLVAMHVPRSRYRRLLRVTHYSQYLSQENYRSRVQEEVARSLT